MRVTEDNCPICDKEFGDGERVVIGEKGAKGINRASSESIVATAGAEVNKRYCMSYINKKQINLYNKAKMHQPPLVKRSAHVSMGPYDSRMHCVK